MSPAPSRGWQRVNDAIATTQAQLKKQSKSDELASSSSSSRA